jgi:c-di-GMP-binding flagellar brake protein YcgR
MGEERRRFPRVPEPFSVQYRLSGDISSWCTAATVDLSACGIRMRVEEPIEHGTLLRLKVILPGLPEPMELRGLVIWTLVRDAGTIECGIEFADVTLKQQVIIDRMVGFLKKRV